MSLTLLASNNASTVLASSINASATTLTVNTGTGALFPSPVSGTSFFKLSLIDAATGQLTEIVHVTARTGDVMTVERAQEGTVARAWSANDIAANMMTAGTLSYILGLGYGSGRLLSIKAFTASGTYTKTPGTSHVRARVWGAGGGGGNTATSGQAAGGGCGGGYAEGYYDTSEITTLTVTVGAGGANVAAGVTGTGGAGGGSSFGSIISATGGTGSIPSSAGGAGSGGNIINFTANAAQGTLTTGIAGSGGASFSSSTAAPHTATKGDDGSFPGGGGAGGNAAYASGKGAAGYVVIEEYS